MGLSIFNFGKANPFYQPKYYEEETEGTYKPHLYNVSEDYYQENVPTYYGDYGAIWASGEKVKELQEWLNKTVRKYWDKLKVDGIYGENTKKAVEELQDFIRRTLRIPIKVDGFYGCKTYAIVRKIASKLGWEPPPPPIWGNCGQPVTCPNTGVVARGDKVVNLQKWLNTIPIGGTIKVDGLYGKETACKVAKVQAYLNKFYGERLRIDGLYGINTYNAILRHLRELGWNTPPKPIFGTTTTSSVLTYNSGTGTGVKVGTTPQATVKQQPNVSLNKPQNDTIFGIKKEYVYIGGAVGLGLLAILLLSDNSRGG